MNSRQVNLKMQASKLLLCGVILIQLFVAQIVAQRSESPWQTLSGEAPRVIARGGFSGLFPDSSLDAYKFAISTSVAGAVPWCDVHLTKDGVGICFPDLNLANASNIQDVYPSRQKTYPVNGVPTQGWFTIGGNKYAISTIQNVATVVKPEGFWLNIQNDVFYAQQNLNITSFLLSVSKTVRKISSHFGCIGPNFVFQFLELDDFELTTNRTYYYILDDLRFVKTFASGILVPKSYIWPHYENIHICK